MNIKQPFKFFKKIYSFLNGYFWSPCDLCGQYFGGFEIGKGYIIKADGTRTVLCKHCDYESGILEGIRRSKINGAD